MAIEASRRAAILVAAAGAAAGLAACKGHGEGGEDISASEDLMREHGVLRRILVLYREAARRLRSDAGAVDASVLSGAANLFRQFGEDYHERKLEEERVFPQVRKAGGPAAHLVDTLTAQHNRGREINLFVIDRCRGGRIGGGDVEAVAKALDSFARMYEVHAAIEDTVVFQAWRKSLSKHQLDEASDEFEKIERAQFKGDGFDIGVDAIAALERRLGIADLGAFTAPSPGPLMA
jgi:hemerythrin-like domain-containing protein